MFQDKFIVKIPIDDFNFVETKFKTQKDVCDFLDIKPNTFNSLISGRLKLKHKFNHKLKGIIVQRILLNTSKPIIDIDAEEQKIKDYKNNLLLKIKN